MSLVFLLLCSLAPPAPFSLSVQGETLGARVEELLLDLEDPLLCPAARIELLALGDLAAVEIAERCIWPPRHSGYLPARCWQPVLQAMGPQARRALDRALAVAADDGVDGSTQWRAMDLAEALALTVPATAQDVLRLPKAERLAARVALGPEPSPAGLIAALSGDDAYALEAALELLQGRGVSAARHAPRLIELWDARAELRVNLEWEGERLRLRLLDLLAEALIAIQPDHPGIAAAYAQVLRIDRPAPQKLETIAAITALGPRAGEAVPALVDALLHFDDAVCRGALEAITRLGAVAAAALPAVQDRIEHAADAETGRLARIAKRRIGKVQDPQGQIEDLIADLVHPLRWKAAALELRALGPLAAEALLADAETPAAQHVRSVARDIVVGIGPAVAEVLARRVPTHFDVPTLGRPDLACHRLAVLVDLAVDTRTVPQMRARLAAIASEVPAHAAVYARAVDRLDLMERLWTKGNEAALELALRHGTAGEAAMAARMLRGRAFATRPQVEALADLVDRDRGSFAWSSETEMLQDPAQPDREAARALVELAGDDPISVPAYELLVRGEWHLGLRVQWIRQLGSADAFAADAGRIAASVLDRKDDEVIRAAAATLTKLGTRARDTEAALVPIAAQHLNRANARAAQRALAAIRGEGR